MKAALTTSCTLILCASLLSACNKSDDPEDGAPRPFCAEGGKTAVACYVAPLKSGQPDCAPTSDPGLTDIEPIKQYRGVCGGDILWAIRPAMHAQTSLSSACAALFECCSASNDVDCLRRMQDWSEGLCASALGSKHCNAEDAGAPEEEPISSEFGRCCYDICTGPCE